MVLRELNRATYVEKLREMAIVFAEQNERASLGGFVIYVTGIKDLDTYLLSTEIRFLDEGVGGMVEDSPAHYEREVIKEACESPFVYGYVFGSTAEAEVGGRDVEILILIYEGEFEPVVIAVLLDPVEGLKVLVPLIGADNIRQSGEVTSSFIGTYQKDLVGH